MHPLRRFPGHPAWKASHIPYTLHVLRGDLEKAEVIGKMHAKYGKIVRIAPDTLAFADAKAWKGKNIHFGGSTLLLLTLMTDLGGHKQGQIPNAKDLSHFPPTPPGAIQGIITADDRDHARFRRLLSPAFSLRALEEQQSIIIRYIDQLVRGIADEATRGPIDIAAFMQWTLFDVCYFITS